MENDQLLAADSSIDNAVRHDAPPSYGSLNMGQAASVVAGGLSTSEQERMPLLSRKSTPSEVEDDARDSQRAETDFSNLPWWRRPSIFWIIPPFFVFATAFGGIIVPRVNLFLSLICDDYFSDRARKDPGFVFTPVIVGGENPQCQTDEIQALVAKFTLYTNLLSGLISAVSAPLLGAYSDRHGRLKVIAFTSAGLLVQELIVICVARNPGVISINWILVGYVVDGMTGSFIAGMAITHAYASDCTTPARRAVAFGYFHGTLFTGIAVGPIIAGKIVAATGDLLSMFYVAVGAHIFFIVFLLFIIPESLTKARQFAAREKRDILREAAAQAAIASGDPTWLLLLKRTARVFEPLRILWPTGAGSSPSLRRNLVLLASIDFVIFGVAMGVLTVIVLYSEYMFKWQTDATSTFVSIANIGRVTVLFLILPLINRLIRGKAKDKSPVKSRNNGSDRIDLILIQVSIVFDVLGFLGYAMAKTGGLFIASAIVAAGGAIASPTVESAMTRHVPSDRVGQMLGAVGLLHALGRIVAPTVFNLIYAKTVSTVPQTVFICVAVLFGVALLCSFFLRTHVYFEEPLRPSTGETTPQEDDNIGEDNIEQR